MELIALDAGYFSADGGAMFGVVPKALWKKRYKCDNNNMCLLSLRCLLIQFNDRLVLIETGVGNKMDPTYLENNGTASYPNIFSALETKNISTSQITDVILTHLHWDHTGGATKIEDGKCIASFPNATYWVGQRQWENAQNSNIREQTVYFEDNYLPLQKNNQLRFIDNTTMLCPEIEMRLFDGHTPGQIIPFIKTKVGTLVYTSDLIPTTAHLPIPWVSAYDSFPLTVYKEKEKLLKEVVENNYFLLFEHDYYTEIASVKWERKHPEVAEKMTVKEFQQMIE